MNKENKSDKVDESSKKNENSNDTKENGTQDPAATDL